MILKVLGFIGGVVAVFLIIGMDRYNHSGVPVFRRGCDAFQPSPQMMLTNVDERIGRRVAPSRVGSSHRPQEDDMVRVAHHRTTTIGE